MTDKLSNYSTTPGSNNAASPDGWPEGQTAGSVNNSDREFAARVREFYEDPTWIDFGHTIVSSTASSIKLSTDLTAVYTAGRPIRVNQSGSQTGYVTASAYSAPDTSITVSGFTVSMPTQVEVGAIYSASQIPSGISISVAGLAVSGTLTAGVISTSLAFMDSITVGTITATEYHNSNGDPFTRHPNLSVKTSGTAASWTWPTGVTVVMVTGVGGGGAGGGSFPEGSGGGGGGGGTFRKRLEKIPGLDTITYTVGAAGAATTVVYNSVTYTANNGTAGTSGFAAGAGGTGGAGGTATNGDENITGGYGGSGGAVVSGGGPAGGSGGGSTKGFGGGGGSGSTTWAASDGSAATGYGGGGGGGGSGSSGTATGGAGSAGVVIFEY